MGFIEETGAAQHLRDARIAPIYEGTNGIQAIDLVTRKLPLGEGSGGRAIISPSCGELRSGRAPRTAPISGAWARACLPRSTTCRTTSRASSRPAPGRKDRRGARRRDALSAPFALAAGGADLAKAALAAPQAMAAPASTLRIGTARFFAEQLAAGDRGA